MHQKPETTRSGQSVGGSRWVLQGGLASFIVGLLVGTPIWVPGGGSSAGASVFCEAQQSVEAARTDSGGTERSHRGSKAISPDGMWVVNRDTITCERVSSILVQNPAGGVAEIGYSEWHYPDKDPFCGDDNSPELPRRLIFVGRNDTSKACWPARHDTRPSLSQGWHTFTIANASLDFDFDFYVDGVYIHTLAADFNTGYSIANAERWHENDTEYAHFRSMEYQDVSGWHSWNYRKCFADNDYSFWLNPDIGPAEVLIERNTQLPLTC